MLITLIARKADNFICPPHEGTIVIIKSFTSSQLPNISLIYFPIFESREGWCVFLTDQLHVFSKMKTYFYVANLLCKIFSLSEMKNSL